MPPQPGPLRRRPSRRQIAARRTVALLAVGTALALLGWLAVSAIGGGGGKPRAAAPSTDSNLRYVTVTRSSSTGPVTTVIAYEKPLRIVFPEGFTRAQMAARIAAVNEIARRKRHVRPALSPRQYLAATKRGRVPRCFHGNGVRTLEGFLFPATYDFVKRTTSGQLVKDQLDAFCENWRKVDLAYSRSKNLTPYDVLKIASMVEKETLAPDERQLVAAVVYNRLHARMPVGIDATLRYGLHIPPTQSIRKSQLDSRSPYNTRKLPGLPPTPIANPGLASIQAAAHPARVKYLYFVRKPDKKHHFFTASYKAFKQFEATHGYGG